ncbi:hypothetical protein RJ639_031024, partial [Escallonia herrerae]
ITEMGCALSKSSEEEDDVVSFCRDRKRLMKSAVEKRYALSEAYCKYNKSLYAVALAIRLFVARHSSPSSPFLVTFSQPSDSGPTKENEALVSNSMFSQQKPSESTTHRAIPCEVQDSLELERGSLEREKGNQENGGGDDESDENDRELCEHFYGEGDPLLQSPENDFGWDFFNPFDEVVVNGVGQTSDDDDMRAVRQAEGIPELEEVGERVSDNKERNLAMGDGVGGVKAEGDADASQAEQHKGLQVIDTSTNGRELLEALKDVEDHFIRAYDSGVDVSKMLETNMMHLQTDMEEIKESSNKLIQSITWRRSTLTRSSSCKSFLSSSSKSSSTWTGYTGDLFDEFGAMESGNHSSTLGRLYAWEQKLYEEVKAGYEMRKLYQRKCSQLSNQDAKGNGFGSLDKTRDEVRDLHSQILVTIRTADSISKRIQKLRDEELQPQLVELLHGLVRTWKVMMKSHQVQNRTMFEVKSFNCPAFGQFSNDSHRLATLQLEAELENWHACFAGYVSAQKAYIKALNGWASKFIAPEIDLYPCVSSSVPQYQINGPPLLVICQDWLVYLEKLPSKTVAYALKSFGKDLRALWAQQGVEQQQKRKVDGLAVELDRKLLAYQRAERKTLEVKLSVQRAEEDVPHRTEYLAEKKNLLDMLEIRLDAEKTKHNDSILETQRVILNGFQTGFSSVFASLMEFSEASMEMYTYLAAHGKKSMRGVDMGDGSLSILPRRETLG